MPYRRALSVLLLTPHFPASPSSISLIFPDRRRRRAVARSLFDTSSHSLSVTFFWLCSIGNICSSSLVSQHASDQTQIGAAQFGLSRDRDFFGPRPRPAPRNFVATRSRPQLAASSGFCQNPSCHRIHRNILGSPVLIRSNDRHSTPTPADVR